MPKGYYTHLTYDQRCQISVLLKRGCTQKVISEELDVSQSTVSREINRNKGKRGYRYKQAQVRAKGRELQQRKTANRKVTSKLWLLIEHYLTAMQWSPEQISGRFKRTMKISISHEAIYGHIWRDKKKGGSLYKHLRRQGKKYHKRANKFAGRGLIPNRVDISKRPKIVTLKKRIGDLEADTIIGSKHKGAIVSIVDRKTKFTFLALISRPTAVLTADTIIALLHAFKKYIHTITADNGKEFARHTEVSKALKADVYFATPYHAWERGLNENTNGLIRQYFPKKCDFTKLTNREVKRVEYLLNNRPRKSLKYRTPSEVFLQLTGSNLR